MSGGYSQNELEDIQAKWHLRFPPDLIALYRERRRVIEHEDERFSSFDWIKEPDQKIQDMLDWPFEGFWFDAQHNLSRWWPEWGEVPVDLADRQACLREIFSRAPRLIPVYGHRYIPEEPHEPGNPIFSVYQMDVIYYGANLADYIARETQTPNTHKAMTTPRSIPFWSRAVERNKEYFREFGSARFFNKDGLLP